MSALRLPICLALIVAGMPAGALLAASDRDPPVQLAQVTIRDRISIRIHTRPPIGPRVPEGTRKVWSEKKAPRCLPVARLAGAALTGGGDVDLLLVDGGRLRAKLDRDCPILNFYQGFYLDRHADGQICADRDSLKARSGTACPIARFRRLEAHN